MTQIGVLGIKGRTGQWIEKLIHSEFASQCCLSAAPLRHEEGGSLMQSDVIIDFSSVTAVLEWCQQAPSNCKLPALVIGSTGWQPEDLKFLSQWSQSKQALVFMSANFSMGIYLMTELLKTFSPFFRNLGYSPVMIEKHHRFKKDTPSGTALELTQALKEQDAFPIYSIRAGGTVGQHEVIFYGAGDEIELKHTALDRSIFARGALEVALWLTHQSYTGRILKMNDFFQSKVQSGPL